jgi:serine/threonine-protein kinase RsbW
MKTRTIELPAELESLTAAAQFTDDVIREVLGDSPPAHLGYNISLAVSEALTNAIRHCGCGKIVGLEFSWDQQQVAITVTDQGEALHMADISEPDFKSGAEGGYGLYIMQQLMDDIRVENFSGGKRLLMIKHLNQGSG